MFPNGLLIFILGLGVGVTFIGFGVGAFIGFGVGVAFIGFGVGVSFIGLGARLLIGLCVLLGAYMSRRARSCGGGDGVCDPLALDEDLLD